MNGNLIVLNLSGSIDSELIEGAITKENVYESGTLTYSG